MRRLTLTQSLISGLAMLALLAPLAWSQSSTGTISGTVRDQSNAVLIGASVTLTKTNTNETFKSPTNNVGLFIFPSLVPGPYKLAVESPGMEKYEATLTLMVEQTVVVNPTMKVGATTAEVKVEEVATQVQSDSGTVNATLDHERIEQLPINGRTVTTLLNTIPGMEGTRSFGIEDHSFAFLVDGADIASRDGWNEIPQRQPGLDSVQEFAVLSNSESAKYARPTTIVLSTKGGTNQLHGAAFETNRDNGYGLARSRTDNYTTPPPLIRNEFGISAGGPVYIPKVYNGKNRTFWFFSYEALRQVQDQTIGFPVPTAAWRNGNMAGDIDTNNIPYIIYNPTTTDPTTWSRQPFPGNQIPQSMLSPLAKTLLGVTPLPTLSNVNPNIAPNWYGAEPSTDQRNWTTVARIDQKFGDRDTFYGRYTQGNYSTLGQFYTQPTLNESQIPSGEQGYQSPNRIVALSWVHIASPTLFNEVLVSGTWQPFFVGTGNLATNYSQQLGLPSPFNLGGWPAMYYACCTSVGAEGYSFETQNTNAAHEWFGVLDDNATKVWGKHEFQFGFHFRYDQEDILPAQQYSAGETEWNNLPSALYDPSTGVISPAALPYTGDTYAAFYMGMNQFYAGQFTRQVFYGREKEYASYFQDNFKVTPRLTLNLGLRYEYWPAFSEKNGVVDGFDAATGAEVLGATPQKMYAVGAALPIIVAREQQLGAKFETAAQAGQPSSLQTPNPFNFAPRLGFAYRVTGGTKPLILRGGYGLAYYHVSLNAWGQRMRSNAPEFAKFFYNMTSATYAFPGTSQCTDGVQNCSLRVNPTVIAGLNSSNVININSPTSIQPGTATLDYFALNQTSPRVHNWNVTLQKELKWGIVATASYIGNHSTGMEQLYNFNASQPAYIYYVQTGQPAVTGTYASTYANNYNTTTWGSIEEWINTGWGNSNGVSLQLEKRFKSGTAFQFFYVNDNNFAAGGNGYSGTSQLPTPNQFLPGSGVPVLNGIPTSFNGALPALDRLYDYQRDAGVPKQRYRWNWVQDIPIGKGKMLLGNANPVLNKIIGGWQIAGIGSANSTYLTLPSGDFPNPGVPVSLSKYNDPIQNCTSGTCYPGYLYYNGYIPANLINSHNAAGQPNGYEGIPSNFQASVAPLIPYGATSAPLNVAGAVPAPAGTNMASYYNTNTVWVQLNNGTIQRTTWSGLAPLRQQYLPSIFQWGLDATLVKNVPIKERMNFRLQCDFFNVLNHPGNPNSIGTTGILSTQSSGNSPRTLQLSGRFSW